MKKSNKSLSISALLLLLAGLLFTASNVAFSAEEKAAEDGSKEVAADTDKKSDTDGDKKKKKEKEKDGDEEPECE